VFRRCSIRRRYTRFVFYQSSYKFRTEIIIFQKAYLDLQKQVAQLQEENKTLRASNLDLNLAAASRRSRASTSKKAIAVQSGGTTASDESSESILNLVHNIMKLGQHYQLFWCIILDVFQFSRENCPEWNWDDFEVRYSSPQLQKQGPTAELYMAVPEEYHDLMALSTSSESGKNFVKHVCIFIYSNPSYIPINLLFSFERR
jgi:hypothetical protein